MIGPAGDIKDTETDAELAESLFLLQEHKNIMSMIADYEQKNMTVIEEINFFKYLFDSGLIWTMPDSYIKRVEDLLDKNLLFFN